jgi:uncharacterized protein
MYLVQFNAPKVITYTDPRAFEKRAKRWLAMREGENSYLLGMLPEMVAQGPRPTQAFLTVEEDQDLVAAGVFKNNILCLTWATHEVFDAVADHAVNSRWRVAHVCAPGHVAYFVGKAYADRIRHSVEIDRGERIYQLARVTYPLPENARLEVATPADRPLVREWVQSFIEEANFEKGVRTFDEITDGLINPRLLYLWKSPHPVSMAAWVSPTPNGASINFVYTPPQFRGQGYGKAVSAALGAQMLASGLKYCFILTDIHDQRSNGVYQAIGARTLCEFLRCTIRPKISVPRSAAPQQECSV